MTSSVNFTKTSFNYKKTEQAVGDVPTPINTTSVFWKVHFGTQDVSEKFAAPTYYHQIFLKICTYEKIDRVDNKLMCTIAEAYEE